MRQWLVAILEQRSMPWERSSVLHAALALLCCTSPLPCTSQPVQTWQLPGLQSSMPASWDRFPSNTSAPFNYSEALLKSLLYFQVQHSGNFTLPALAWRADSCKDCQVRLARRLANQRLVQPAASCCTQGGAAPQGAYGEDLSGGYYEAGGSYMKMALQEAFVLTQLAWTGAHTACCVLFHACVQVAHAAGACCPQWWTFSKA